MTMRTLKLSLLPLALAAAAVHAEDSASLTDALTGGKLTLDSRMRYEGVSDDAVARDANALTWRNRVGYKTAPWHGFSVYVEAEDVRALEEDYNSTANGRTQYATVADPEGSEWNQAYVGWDSGKGTQFAAGRQRINLDNQRFIGAVGWRQNEQTFDAFTATHTFANKTTLRYAYLQDVHRVFGNEHPNPLSAEYDLDGQLLNLAHPFALGTLSAYGYLIDNQDLPLTSTRTFGARFAGAKAMAEPWKLVYALEYARQSDWRGGAANIDADYSLLEIGASRGAYTGKIAQETLGGDGHYAFQTPFATLHAFNGWADKFLVTPVNGLVDRYVQFNGPIGKLQWIARYHSFDADHGSASYGSEWNASLAWPINARLSALAKFARYDADSFARDTDKLWLSVEYKY
jgi:hypothetical protein